VIDFEETVVCRAPALQVWKLLHDPTRFPEWWVGITRSQPTADGAVVQHSAWEHGDLPLFVTATRDSPGVVIRCPATGRVYSWALEPHPDGCRVRVRVEVPDGQYEQLRLRRETMLATLPQLAATAERPSTEPA
jgi:hypothetical protein